MSDKSERVYSGMPSFSQFSKMLDEMRGRDMAKISDEPAKMETREEKYVRLQSAADFQVGDIVKVTAKAIENQFGWQNSWEGRMNKSIDNNFTVVRIANNGIGLNDDGRHAYPFFVLELVERPKKKEEDTVIADEDKPRSEPASRREKSKSKTETTDFSEFDKMLSGIKTKV